MASTKETSATKTTAATTKAEKDTKATTTKVAATPAAVAEKKETTAAKKTEKKTSATAAKKTTKKAATKKTTAKKTTAKKTAKKAEIEHVFEIQYEGKNVSYADIKKMVDDKLVEQGAKPLGRKNVDIYVNPMESKVYYVSNAGKTSEIKGELEY